MRNKYDFDVDIVITWVDGSDKEWLKEKNKYLDDAHQINIDARVNRYRDWDNVQYIFRGIEKFAPWVRKVFFITCGQKPKWLNLDNEKLVFVNHKDYIPSEYLPTFSSRPIELNMHRIKGLSEHFVYLNDDFFFTKPTKKSDFFDKNGLPKLVAMEKPKNIGEFVFDNITMNNVRAISNVFNKWEVKKKYKHKWFRLTDPVCFIMNKFYNLTAKAGWAGFYIDHLPVPFLKSAICECWEKFPDILDKTSKNRFRSIYDVNQYLFIEYMLCSNQFEPLKFRARGKAFNLSDSSDSNIEYVCKSIKNQKHKTICLNDAKVENFNEVKEKINTALQYILPQKSSFEI